MKKKYITLMLLSLFMLSGCAKSLKVEEPTLTPVETAVETSLVKSSKPEGFPFIKHPMEELIETPVEEIMETPMETPVEVLIKEEPKAEVPVKEEPKVETPVKEEPKVETPVKEAPKEEVPLKEPVAKPEPTPAPAVKPTPTPTPAPEPVVEKPETVATYTVMASVEKGILTEVNRYRTEAGLSELTWDNSLAASARDHSITMFVSNKFAHTQKYNVKENIFLLATSNASRFTASTIVEKWMQLADQKANILNPNITKLGAGAVSGGQWSTRQNALVDTLYGTGHFK